MFSLSYINLEKDEVEIKNGFKSDKEAYDYIANHKEVLPLKLLIWSEARQCNREIEAFVKYWEMKKMKVTTYCINKKPSGAAKPRKGD